MDFLTSPKIFNMIKSVFLPLAAAVLFLFSDCNHANKSCCGDAASTEKFAGLGDQKAFQDAHPAPLPTDTVHSGEMIKFAVQSGAEANAYFVKKNDSDRYLMLFHEWWGLNDYIKREADFYANALNINVLCPDLYDGKVATDADAAGKLMGANDKNRSAAIVAGAFKRVGKKATVRTLGWCFGGGWSCQAALIGGKQTVGCVIYYGMPEEDVARLATLNCDALGIFASQDKWINKDVVSKFEANMKKANRSLTVKWFEADHAFANPSSPHFMEKPAQEARELTLAYLKGK